MTEAERVKPRGMFVEEAIQFALTSHWEEALRANREIIEHFGADEDTYNRLGKACAEQGQVQEALDAYAQALEINPLNVIAQKNTRKLSLLLQDQGKLTATSAAIDVNLFTEEPGKSALAVVTPPRQGVAAAVVPGDTVELQVSGSSLHAHTVRGVPLGDVDAKLARRLIPLIATGNTYTAAVARIGESTIDIIIRETFQAPDNVRRSSFPIARSAKRDEFRPYTKDSLLADRGVVVEDEEADESVVPGVEEPVDDDMDGMQTVESDLEEADVEPAEVLDEDERPEDEY